MLTLFPHGVIDTTTSQTRVYIADPGNNRVLAYNDYHRLQTGQQADFVIGQVDFTRVLPNSPLMNVNRPTREGLLGPSSVALDKAGNLYIADTGNGRILRYPKPFERWANGEQQLPDLVIGQADYESRRTEINASLLFRPTSVAISEVGKMVVADPLLNRVMVFQPSEVINGVPQFADGQEALISSDSLPLQRITIFSSIYVYCQAG